MDPAYQEGDQGHIQPIQNQESIKGRSLAQDTYSNIRVLAQTTTSNGPVSVFK